MPIKDTFFFLRPIDLNLFLNLCWKNSPRASYAKMYLVSNSLPRFI
jgi:hypothetical protein